MIFGINMAKGSGRIWDSTPPRSFSVSPLACCPSCCPIAPEPRNVVRSYPGFPDAIRVDRRYPTRLRALGVEQEVRRLVRRHGVSCGVTVGCQYDPANSP